MRDKVKIESFNHEKGINCESNTMCDLLKFHGLDLSEPMIIGLCEGYSFVYLNLKALGFPFVGGRTKDGWLDKFTENTNIEFNKRTTTSDRKARNNLFKPLERGLPVGVGVDYYYMDYIPKEERVHFVGHTISVCGYDEEYVYVGERDYSNIQKLSRKSLKKARTAKVHGMGGADNLTFTVEEINNFDFERVLPRVIKRMATSFMTPSFKGEGYKGIYKLSSEIQKTWPKIAENNEFKGQEFKGWNYVANMWDKWGTGGAIFRNPLRDFLKESLDYIKYLEIEQAYEIYCDVVERYNQMTKIMRELDENKGKEKTVLKELSDLALIQAEKEEKAMSILSKIDISS